MLGACLVHVFARECEKCVQKQPTHYAILSTAATSCKYFQFFALLLDRELLGVGEAQGRHGDGELHRAPAGTARRSAQCAPRKAPRPASTRRLLPRNHHGLKVGIRWCVARGWGRVRGGEAARSRLPGAIRARRTLWRGGGGGGSGRNAPSARYRKPVRALFERCHSLGRCVPCAKFLSSSD